MFGQLSRRGWFASLLGIVTSLWLGRVAGKALAATPPSAASGQIPTDFFSSGKGVTTYSYSDGYTITRLEYPIERVISTYDAQGNLVRSQVVYSKGRTTTYVYDGRERVTQIWDSGT